MKIETAFNPTLDLILLPISIFGPTTGRRAMLALDTGSSETIVVPELAVVLGYSAKDAIQLTSVTSVVGREYGYRLRVEKFSALGFSVPQYEVNVHDLPEDCGFDGLLGLSFLRILHYEIRSADGLILASLV